MLYIYKYPPTLPSNCCGRAAPGTTVGVELCSLASASMNVAYQCYGHLLVLTGRLQILHFFTEAIALGCDPNCGQPNPPQQFWQSAGSFHHHSPTSYCRPKLTDGTFCHLQKLRHCRIEPSGSLAPPQPYQLLQSETDGWHLCHLQKLRHSRMAPSGSFAPPQPYQLLQSETDGWHLLPPSKAPPQPHGTFRQLCATTALPVIAVRN